MGLELANAARRREDVRASARHLLLNLAVSARDATGVCWGKVRKLAEQLLVSERTVQRALRQLEDLGLLTIRRGRGRGHVNVYTLWLEAPERVTERAAQRVTQQPGARETVTLSACGQPVRPPAQRVTSCRLKGDMGVTQKRSERKKGAAPAAPVDRWPSGSLHLSGLSAISSSGFSGGVAPFPTGGSPLSEFELWQRPERSTRPSLSGSWSSQPALPIGELVASFLAGARAAEPRLGL